MSSSLGAPGGIERRAHRGLSLVPQPLPAKALKSAIDDTVTVKLSQDVFVECSTRRHLIMMLDRQVALSQQVKRPLCLALCAITNIRPLQDTQAQIMPQHYPEAALNVVGKIFKSHLRPSDVLLKPSNKTLGVVLLDADLVGAATVTRRLLDATRRPLFFGKSSVEVTVKFGISHQMDGFGGAGASLLATAERALDKAIKSDDTLMELAELSNGPQKNHQFLRDEFSPDGTWL